MRTHPCVRTLSVLGMLALSGCATVAVPIRPYGYKDTCEHPTTDKATTCPDALADAPTKPRDRARNLLRDWDRAISELQAGNSTAGTILPAIAGAIGYRAGRGKGSAATAALAATGLVGQNISDSMLQLSRLNVYIEGIAALECAVDPYDASGLESMESLTGVRDPTLLEYQSLRDAYWELELKHKLLTSSLDQALGRAVSRIARDANKALSGSIVSVQSTNYDWSYAGPTPPPPPPSDEEATDKQKALEGEVRLSFTREGKAISQPDIDNEKAQLKRILLAEQMLSRRSALIPPAIEQIDSCAFAATATRTDRRASDLSILAPDFAGKTVSLKAGETTLLVIQGGTPGYTVESLPDDPQKLTAEQKNVAGSAVIEVTAVSPAAKESVKVVVSDGGSPKRTRWIVVEIEP